MSRSKLDRLSEMDYVETITARSKNYPISYDTLSKTFFKMLYLRHTIIFNKAIK